MFTRAEIINPTKPKKKPQFTAQARRSHVRAFENSSETMSSYCKKHSIAISTLSTWVAKYSKKSPVAFVPGVIQNKKPGQTLAHKETASTARIEIHRGDLKIILPVLSDIPLVIEIIKGVFLCS